MPFPPTEKPRVYLTRPAADLSFVANYLNQDSDLWVFRRFGKLHLFNILNLQQRLAKLESTLETKLWQGDRDEIDDLYDQIKVALKEYDDALAAQAQHRTYRQPEKRIMTLFKQWWNEHHGRGSALRFGLNYHGDEDKCLTDLASIAAVEKSWTHRFIDRHDRLRRRFAKKDVEAYQGMTSTLLYSELNVRRAEAVFLHACFCFLLLCPIFALSYVNSKGWKLGILTIFLFAAAVLTVGFLDTPNKNALTLVAG